jgi:hypothetical protein
VGSPPADHPVVTTSGLKLGLVALIAAIALVPAQVNAEEPPAPQAQVATQAP